MKKNILYGLGAFCIFLIFTVVLRLISGKYPENPFLFKIFQKSDFGLGFIVAIVLTYARYLRRR